MIIKLLCPCRHHSEFTYEVGVGPRPACIGIDRKGPPGACECRPDLAAAEAKHWALEHPNAAPRQVEPEPVAVAAGPQPVSPWEKAREVVPDEELPPDAEGD